MGKFENELSTTIDAILNALGYSPQPSQKQDQTSLSSPYFTYKSNQQHVPGVYGSTHLLGVSPVIHEPPLMSPWTNKQFCNMHADNKFLNSYYFIFFFFCVTVSHLLALLWACKCARHWKVIWIWFRFCTLCFSFFLPWRSFKFLWSNGTSIWNFF